MPTDPLAGLRSHTAGTVPGLRSHTDGAVLAQQDRAKDLIIRGGENISCAEVESAVYEHPSVKEATSFGMKEERLGEEVAVAITPKDGEEIDGAELVGTAHPLPIRLALRRLCAYHPGMSL